MDLICIPLYIGTLPVNEGFGLPATDGSSSPCRPKLALHGLAWTPLSLRNLVSHRLIIMVSVSSSCCWCGIGACGNAAACGTGRSAFIGASNCNWYQLVLRAGPVQNDLLWWRHFWRFALNFQGVSHAHAARPWWSWMSWRMWWWSWPFIIHRDGDDDASCSVSWILMAFREVKIYYLQMLKHIAIRLKLGMSEGNVWRWLL